MSVYGIADSTQLDMLAGILDEYCLDHRVTDADERERIASQIIHLFNAGLTTAELLRAGLCGQERRVA